MTTRKQNKNIIEIVLCYIVCFILFSFSSCNKPDDENNTPSTTDPNEIENITWGNNLLKNGDLEEWESLYSNYGQAVGWDVPAISYDWVKRNNTIVYNGKFSAKMRATTSGVTARISQLVPVKPRGKIRIRFRYYLQDWKANGARTYCYFQTGVTESTNISISELRSFYTDDEYYIIRGGGYGKKYLPHEMNRWVLFDQTINVPPTAKYFDFGINSYYGTTLYLDNCYIGEAL